MNKLERLVYDFVKHNPALKMRIVKAYQRACAIVPQRKLVAERPVTVREGYFYGFHDKSPFSPDNSRLLGHRVLVDNRSVRAGEAADVGFFEGDGWRDFRRVGSTTAWDWQLGSMLQWRAKSSTELVHNDFVDGQIGSRIRNVDGSEIAAFTKPVVHVNPDGQRASSYCFRRVGMAMKGYGVRYPGDERYTIADFQGDGPGDFSLFSLVDGATLWSLSLDQIRAIDPHPSMPGAFHFFHHSLFNPSGTRLFILHRWLDSTSRLWTRMFACDAATGANLFLFPTHEMVSHIGWIDDQSILAYARSREQGDGYYILRDGSQQWERVAQEAFNSDGHPMMSPRGGVFVTDTYPDRFRNQFLYLYDLRARASRRLARTHLGLDFLDDLQVDLHPRFDRTGDVVCFDSGHPGRRSLCTLALTDPSK
jgi:hypothetical protein